MHPLKALRKILERPSPNNGKIVANGATLLVATREGQMTIPRTPGDVTQYSVGDDVILVNGVVVGRRNRNSTIYVL